MSSAEKLQVFATQGNQLTLKCRLSCAKRGESLLRKKSDGLRTKFRASVQDFLAKESRVLEIFRESRMAMAEVRFVLGNLNQQVLQSVEKARIRVSRKQTFLAGLRVEVFETLEEDFDDFLYAGLAGGRQQIQKAKMSYRRCVYQLIELASLRRTFLAFERAISIVSHRVNALRHLIVPKLEATLSYLSVELDEFEREEFFRLKKLKTKRKALKERQGRRAVSNILRQSDEDLLF